MLPDLSHHYRGWPAMLVAFTLCATSWIAMELLSPPAMTSARSVNDRSGSKGSEVNVRSAPFGAKGDGRTDDTAAIQAAINASVRVHIPAGIYKIDPRVGLVIRTGTQLTGDGRASTLLVAAPGGSSLRQLAAYGPGSIIHRRFDPGVANAYVAYVRLADFSVILTHPRQVITDDAVQIGIDLRNVSRSLVERVHVGNTLPINANLRKTPGRVFDSQGYGIVLGSVPSSLPGYSGGELNVVRDVNVWGAYKAIVLDDEVLSPRSAAHGTVIERADLQGAQTLVSQESPYARAVIWRDLILQNVIPQPGGNDQATVIRIDGQDSRVEGGYVEAGGLASYLVRLGSSARHVGVHLLHISCTNQPITLDQGQDNVIVTPGDCRTVISREP